MRRTLLLLLKAAVSILLIYLSLRAVNLAALGDRLSRIDAGWIAAAFFLQMLQIALLAYRWQTIVACCGPILPFAATLRIIIIASFFNQVLPSTVGGDAARIWMLRRTGSSWASAAYSVVIDRIVGVLALATLVIVCLPWTLTLLHNPTARALLLLIGIGAIAGAIVFLAIGLLRWPILQRWGMTRHLVEASRIAWRLCRSWRLLATVGAASFAIHLLTIAAAWCMVQSVAASVDFVMLLFLIPPVLLIATVPISIAGWGLREGSMIVAFSYAGLAQSDGLIVSVLIGLVMFGIGAVGGIVWITSDTKGVRLSELADSDEQSRSSDGV